MDRLNQMAWYPRLLAGIPAASQAGDFDGKSPGHWLIEEAVGGSADAAYSLGCCYLVGAYRPQDGVAGLAWLQASAEAGQAAAVALLQAIGFDPRQWARTGWYLKALRDTRDPRERAAGYARQSPADPVASRAWRDAARDAAAEGPLKPGL